VNVKELIGDFTGHQHAMAKAPGTVAKRRCELRSWHRWIGDRWQVADFRDVEAWLEARPIGARAKNSAVSHLRAFYRWARREGLTDADPCRDVDLPRNPRYVPRPATDRAVARAIGEGVDRCELACALMAYAGLRCVEVSRLTWDDVDLVAGRLHVLGKGDKEGYVPVGPPLRALLARGDGLEGPVVTTWDGRRLTPTRVCQIVNAHLRRRKCGCTAHQLRHWAATHLLELSGDLCVVRDFMRHSSIAQTEGYAQLAGGRLAAAIAAW
jgi:site-specific recombinase XerD